MKSTIGVYVTAPLLFFLRTHVEKKIAVTRGFSLGEKHVGHVGQSDNPCKAQETIILFCPTSVRQVSDKTAFCPTSRMSDKHVGHFLSL